MSYVSGGGEQVLYIFDCTQIEQRRLKWNAESKVGSLEKVLLSYGSIELGHEYNDGAKNVRDMKKVVVIISAVPGNPPSRGRRRQDRKSKARLESRVQG